MADDLTRQSERILSEGRSLIRDNRDGGRHRRMPPIGKGSAELRRGHLKRKLRNIAVALGVVWLASVITGIVIQGIGFTGIVITALALLGAGLIFGKFPRMKVPQMADLNSGDVRHMVARTELWLEERSDQKAPGQTSA